MIHYPDLQYYIIGFGTGSLWPYALNNVPTFTGDVR
jgi:hypothetical protein